MPDWKPSDRRRLRRILERLRAEYGRPVLEPHEAPIDELVLTVLSQNTNDRNRDVAYGACASASSRAQVRDAPTEPRSRRRSAPAAWRRPRPCGSSRSSTRSATTTSRLAGRRARRGGARLPLRAARRRPQDGGLRAAVLLRPPRRAGGHARVPRGHAARAVPPGGAPLEEAHDELLRLTTPEEAYESHVLLIRHGRRTCTARSPRCEECPLLRMCPYGRELWPSADEPDGPATDGGGRPGGSSPPSGARPGRSPRDEPAPALSGAAGAAVPGGHRAAEGPDRGDRHLPRQRRAALPPADDPPVRPRPRALPRRPDAAVPPAVRGLGQARGLRALAAAPAQRGHLLRRGARAVPAARETRAGAAAVVRAGAAVRALALLPGRVLHAAHRQPGAAVRAARPRPLRPLRPLRRRRLAARLRARLRSDGRRRAHAPVLSLAGARGAAHLLRSRLPLERKAIAAGIAALALAPFAVLVAVWGGLVPPGSDPASCGLCADRDPVTLRTVGFTVALFGIYAGVVAGPRWVRRRRAFRDPARCAWPRG